MDGPITTAMIPGSEPQRATALPPTTKKKSWRMKKMINTLKSAAYLHIIIRNWFIQRKLRKRSKFYMDCYWHNRDWAQYYNRTLYGFTAELNFRADVYLRAHKRVQAIKKKYI